MIKYNAGYEDLHGELKKLAKNLTKKKALELLVEAKICNKKGKLLPPYNGDFKNLGYYRTN